MIGLRKSASLTEGEFLIDYFNKLLLIFKVEVEPDGMLGTTFFVLFYNKSLSILYLIPNALSICD